MNMATSYAHTADLVHWEMDPGYLSHIPMDLHPQGTGHGAHVTDHRGALTLDSDA